MKRYINILMVALATMMTSCLTEDPRDQLYEEDIYNNANNIYINAVAVLYNYIGGSADSETLFQTSILTARFITRRVKKSLKSFYVALL